MVDYPESESRELSRQRILVVDDSVDSAMVLALALKLEGHITKTAFDGTSALETAQKFRPDVILLDLGLPDISGTEVARTIRSSQDQCDILLIAVSGYELDAEGRTLFDGFVMKPAELEKIVRLIAKGRGGREIGE